MRMLTNILSTARLTRASIALGAVADIWLVVLLSRAFPSADTTALSPIPLTLALIASAAVAIGFFAFGGVLNDLVDVKRDRALAPERPIPAGQIPARNAVLLASACLLCGFVGAYPFGGVAVPLALLLAVAILIYDAAAKYVPAARLALFGVLSGISMLIPDGRFPFAIVVVMAVLESIATATAAYIVEGKRPLLSTRSRFILAASILCIIAVIVETARITNVNIDWIPGEMGYAELSIPVGVFFIGCTYLYFAARAKCEGDERRRRADQILRRGALWRAVTASAWLIAVGLVLEGSLLLAVASIGFSAMALLRSLTPMPEGPAKWR